jgi:ribosomal protein S18 acetylase RimI-like enzyme
MTIEIRRLRVDDVPPLRRLRLRALRADPDAFADTFADATALPEAAWAEWVGTTFAAIDGERWIAMVAARRLGECDWLEALWVDPGARRTGLGLRLIDAVADWSRGHGTERLELSVTEGNAAARALYARAGFQETGRRRPLPADPSRTEIFLWRSVLLCAN